MLFIIQRQERDMGQAKKKQKKRETKKEKKEEAQKSRADIKKRADKNIYITAYSIRSTSF